MSGSKAAKALRQLSKEPPHLDSPPPHHHDDAHSEYRSHSDHDDDDDNDGPESPTDRFLQSQSHQQKVLARLARKEAEAQSKLALQRKAMHLRRKIKTQNDLFNRCTFEHDDPQYYQYLPMKPGIEAYKWLAPIKEDIVAGKKHHRPGLDALQINIPDTIVYSDRYAGVAEMWLSTSAKNGCIISKRLSAKWIPKYCSRACTAIDTSPSTNTGSSELGLRRPVSVLKISHWKNSESRNITRIVPEYSLAEALKAPTPTPGAVCIQNYVHSRGVHSSCYRVVWNAYKPAVGYMISSEKSYHEREQTSMLGAGVQHKGALVVCLNSHF